MKIDHCPNCKSSLTNLNLFYNNKSPILLNYQQNKNSYFACKNFCVEKHNKYGFSDRIICSVDDLGNLLYYDIIIDLDGKNISLKVSFQDNISVLNLYNHNHNYTIFKFNTVFEPQDNMIYYQKLVRRLLKLKNYS